MKNKLNLPYFLVAVLFLFGLFMLCAFLSSCNSTKQTQKTIDTVDKIGELEQRFKQRENDIKSKAIEDYVKNNPLICPPIEINLDSLCPQNNEPTNAPANDYLPPKNIVNTGKGKIILQPYEDKRKINLLNDSLLAYKLINASLNTAIAVNKQPYDDAIKELEAKHTKDLEEQKNKKNKWLYIFLAAFLISAFINCLQFIRKK
jgi:hypothetical protein